MAATYDSSLIATNILYYARMRFRDVGRLSGTTVGAPLLQDEEYEGMIASQGPREGLAQLAESLAASFAQKVQRYSESGGIAVEWPRRPEFYLKLAQSIRLNGIGEHEGSASGYGGAYGNAAPLPDICTDERLIGMVALP